MTRYLLFFNRLLLAHNSSMKSQWLNSATHNYSICISEPFKMCAQAQCSFGLKGPLLTRPHCTYWLYTRNSKMFSGDCFTERIFQIYFLFKEIEEIESPVIILPGGKCDCQQRHALPLPRVAYASNLPSPPPIPEPRDRVRLTWQAPNSFLSLFFLLCGAFAVVALCIPHWKIYQSCVPWWEIFPGLRFTSWCLCVLPWLFGWVRRFHEREGAWHLVWHFSCFRSVQCFNTWQTASSAGEVCPALVRVKWPILEQGLLR